MSKYDEKVARIRYDHIMLLQKVKDSIVKNKDHLSESLDSVITVLNVEEESTKKYEALVQAQELILSLTQEIVEADNLEKITELRKKVNYYINKIKNELKKRESHEELLSDYQTKVSYLRKDIAKYIRFLKRKSAIQEIEGTNLRYDELNNEEKKKFQKLVRNEIRYNTRNYDLFDQKEVIKVEPTIPEASTTSNADEFDFETAIVDTIVTSVDGEEPVEKTDDFKIDSIVVEEKPVEGTDDFKFDSIVVEEKPAEEKDDSSFDDLSIGSNFSGYCKTVGGTVFSYQNSKELVETPFSVASSYLSKRILEYKKQYDIVDTLDYGASPIKNFVSLIRNIPRYINNRKGMKIMQRDLCLFYRGSDLVSFYEYTRRRNSIQNGLKSIFSRTHLYNDEEKYLSKHDTCSEWLYEFCKNNSMSFLIPLEISK